MSNWVRSFFLKTLPPYLLINLPINKAKFIQQSNSTDKTAQNNQNTTKTLTSALDKIKQSPTEGYVYPAEVNRAIRNALFIAYHLDNENAYENVNMFVIFLFKTFY